MHTIRSLVGYAVTQAEKFWIGHRVDNDASKRGIEKAGFQLVNFVVLTPERQLRLVPRGNLARAQGDPQGRHLGFAEVADEKMIVFDFGDLTDTQPLDRNQMEHWLQRNLAHQDEHGFGLFSVVLKAEDVLIGDCGLERMEVEGEPSTELGYDFRNDYWNQGFATEAASAVRDFAFDTLRLPSLISLIRLGNLASKRVSEKIGMRLDREIDRNGVRYWMYSIERRPKAHLTPP